MRLIYQLGVVVCCGLSGSVIAQSSHSSVVTDAELAMLPEYCQARIAGNETVRKHWSQRMGASHFVHLHHYCFGLNFMSRAAVVFDPKQKVFILRQAIRNFDYVLARWPKEFPLTSQAANYRVQATLMLGQ